MDGRGDVDDTEDRREIRNVIFIFTLRTHYPYVDTYELSTGQIRETHFRFRFHFKRLKIANPKIRKFHQTASKHHSLQQQIDCILLYGRRKTCSSNMKMMPPSWFHRSF